jgi:predicted nucleotidyltransferase
LDRLERTVSDGRGYNDATYAQNRNRPMHTTIRAHRDEILRLAREHGAYNLRLFGSAARGDEQPDSDLEVLVEMEAGRSLLDHVALKQGLEDLLGREVDVVTERSLHPRIRERVLREASSLQ